jgi:phage-related holin
MFKTYFISLIATLKHWFVFLASVFCAFLAPIGDLLYFVSLLVIADFITGVVAAKYRNQKRESIKMARSIYKIVFYLIALMMAQLFDNQFQSLFRPHLLSVVVDEQSSQSLIEFKFLAALSFIIIVRELKSIDENWESIFNWGFGTTVSKLYEGVTSILSLIKSKK